MSATGPGGAVAGGAVGGAGRRSWPVRLPARWSCGTAASAAVVVVVGLAGRGGGAPSATDDDGSSCRSAVDVVVVVAATAGRAHQGQRQEHGRRSPARGRRLTSRPWTDWAASRAPRTDAAMPGPSRPRSAWIWAGGRLGQVVVGDAQHDHPGRRALGLGGRGGDGVGDGRARPAHPDAVLDGDHEGVRRRRRRSWPGRGA